MKTGLGLNKKFRRLFAFWNLCQFQWRKKLLGFDVANQFVQRVDKTSIQLIMRKNGATIGKDCDIEIGLTFHNCSDYSNLIIGDNCHIGKNCFFDLRGEVIIESNVVVSMQCSFITHQDLSKSDLSRLYPASSANILIGNNCYIGVNATILQGVIVGNSSIVAAGSLVKNNIDPNSLVAGIPAKKLSQYNKP